MNIAPTEYDLFVRRWGWLFPAIFVLHILEEHFGGFHIWLAGITGKEPSLPQFLALNIVCLIVMAVGTLVAMRLHNWRGLVLASAVAVVINGVAHLVASIATQSYSPGVLTGMLMWMPLGTYTISVANRSSEKRTLNAFIGLGVGVHVLVLVVAGVMGALSN